MGGASKARTAFTWHCRKHSDPHVLTTSRTARRSIVVSIHTDYLWFHTKKRQEFIRITDEVARIVTASGVAEGMVLVSAMHITAGV